jgi:hypothetical protein
LTRRFRIQSTTAIDRKEDKTGATGLSRRFGKTGKMVDSGELGRQAGEASDMSRQITTGCRLILIAATALMASGCASCFCPVPPIPEDAAARSAALPQVCRNHVYIFLISGQGPLDLGNMGGVRESLISLGYIKTYCGECCYSEYYKDEIRRLHREDESARFVVMGYGLGANTAAEISDAVRTDGVTVDLLVYCGGVTICNDPKNRPSNALRVVHLLSGGVDSLGFALDGADNVQLADANHFGSPTHPFTMELLVKELTDAASRVSVVGLPQPAQPSLEQLPAPRPADETQPRDDWDFLKPSPPAVRPTTRTMPKVL